MDKSKKCLHYKIDGGAYTTAQVFKHIKLSGSDIIGYADSTFDWIESLLDDLKKAHCKFEKVSDSREQYNVADTFALRKIQLMDTMVTEVAKISEESMK